MWFCSDAGSTGALAASVPFPEWKCERLDNGASTSLVQVRVLLRGFFLFFVNK